MNIELETKLLEAKLKQINIKISEAKRERNNLRIRRWRTEKALEALKHLTIPLD